MKKIKPNIASSLILGIDFGDTNTGLALGRNGLVSPLKIVSGKNSENLMHEINRVVVENKIEQLVVGLPLTPDGKDTPESLSIRKLSKLLRLATKRPVNFQNEYGTSIEALEEAIDLGVPQKKRGSNDHLSAALILKYYFNEVLG